MKSKYDLDGWHTSMVGGMHERWLFVVTAADVVAPAGSPRDTPNLKESGDFAYVVQIYDCGAESLFDTQELNYAANNTANDDTMVFEQLCQTRSAAAQVVMDWYCKHDRYDDESPAA